MNDAGISKSSLGKPIEIDIPEALRDFEADLSVDSPQPQQLGRLGRHWRWFFGGLAIALLLGWANYQLPSSELSASSLFVPAKSGLAATSNWRMLPGDLLLGHVAYQEAPTNSLSAVVADGSIKLRQPAAQSFLAMGQAAKANKISLVPVSGFRSIADQTYLFFTLKAKKGLTATERAAVSAPPGHSEHHTGYAIDIADGSRPTTDLEITFETTLAFLWLQANAARFGFELSFPKNNVQGVSYEPWHWRFVGDQGSLETFYKGQAAPPQRLVKP